MKTKSWKYIQNTPAHGNVYHKNDTNDILIIYSRIAILFKNIDSNNYFYPCHAEYEIERVSNKIQPKY